MTDELPIAYLWISRYCLARGEDPYLAQCRVRGRVAHETSTWAPHLLGVHAFEDERDARYAAENARVARLATLKAEVGRLTALHFIDIQS